MAEYGKQGRSILAGQGMKRTAGVFVVDWRRSQPLSAACCPPSFLPMPGSALPPRCSSQTAGDGRHRRLSSLDCVGGLLGNRSWGLCSSSRTQCPHHGSYRCLGGEPCRPFPGRHSNAPHAGCTPSHFHCAGTGHTVCAPVLVRGTLCRRDVAVGIVSVLAARATMLIPPYCRNPPPIRINQAAQLRSSPPYLLPGAREGVPFRLPTLCGQELLPLLRPSDCHCF